VFRRIFPGNPHEEAARSLYEAIVLQARQREFYTHFGVPDTVDGRFDLLLLHMFLVLHRLKHDAQPPTKLSQTLFDTMIFDLDQNVRLSGVGDLGVGPRLKAMAEAFYGRIAAYEAGLAKADEAVLRQTLQRNLYDGEGKEDASVLAGMAAYVRREAAALSAQTAADLAAGRVVFGEPPHPQQDGGESR
jgi:cytochrome b pre-mRNA-processing protein 3